MSNFDSREAYPKEWARVTLMVSPNGEMQAIGGDRTSADPTVDSTYVGLERIKKSLNRRVVVVGRHTLSNLMRGVPVEFESINVGLLPDSELMNLSVGPNADTRLMKVFAICNAYESGYGHGLKDDKLGNPYAENSQEYVAYQIGYDESLRKKKDYDENEAT